MTRQHGDPQPPGLPPSQDLPDPLVFPESAQAPSAWLWHDLALPLRLAPLAPTPALHSRFEALVLGVLRGDAPQSADELSRLCLGLSEGAPDTRSRAFWQLAAGTLEGLALQALRVDESLKQLVSQVLHQFVQVQAQPNGPAVPELLCHELLDACLQANISDGAVVLPRIRQAYAAQPLPPIALSLPDDELVADAEGEMAPPEPAPAPDNLAPMVVSQALQWSRELSEELAAWAPKPNRPLKPTVTVLAQVLQEMLSTAGLSQLATLAAALHAALRRAQHVMTVLPIQADVLVQAAQQLLAHVQTLSAGHMPRVDLAVEGSLHAWPPALQIQEQETLMNQGQEAKEPHTQALQVDVPSSPASETAPLPAKVKRPVSGKPDAPRLLYVQSITPRMLKALKPQGLATDLVLRDPGVALVRTDLQQLGALLDLLLSALRLSIDAQAPVMHISLWPEHDHLHLDLRWGQVSSHMALDDLEMSQAWQLLLAQTGASLQTTGAAAWRLSLPAQHVLCTVQVLRAGDLKLAVPALVVEQPTWFMGRNPPAAFSEHLGAHEVVLQAPSPVMRRVHGVVGVMPKDSGMPVLVYRADLLQSSPD